MFTGITIEVAWLSDIGVNQEREGFVNTHRSM